MPFLLQLLVPDGYHDWGTEGRRRPLHGREYDLWILLGTPAAGMAAAGAPKPPHYLFRGLEGGSARRTEAIV